jgi:hypothetical protein
MHDHGFRVLGRERRRSGPAPWAGLAAQLSRAPAARGLPHYDPRAEGSETRYTIRRDVTCEQCGHSFGSIFEVDQTSRTHADGGTSDGALGREVRRQLRRKIQCPACGRVQREPRDTWRRKAVEENVLGCTAVASPVVIATILVVVGGNLFGLAGIVAGLALAALLAIGVMWFGLLQLGGR